MCVTFINLPFENDTCDQYHLFLQLICAIFKMVLVLLYKHNNLAYRNIKLCLSILNAAKYLTYLGFPCSYNKELKNLQV